VDHDEFFEMRDRLRDILDDTELETERPGRPREPGPQAGLST
jgi:hypothetical protein